MTYDDWKTTEPYDPHYDDDRYAHACINCDEPKERCRCPNFITQEEWDQMKHEERETARAELYYEDR